MKILLDTNIIIYREVHGILNANVHELYFWLDKIKCEKCISPVTISEIEKNRDKETVRIFKAKLKAYNVLPEITLQDKNFKRQLNENFNDKDENDFLDNQLLYEVYTNKVDLLITEDKKIFKKATYFKCRDKIVNIDDFLFQVKKNNPQLKDYTSLAIVKRLFRYIDINDVFFESLKNDYKDFLTWFEKKKDEEAYVCYRDEKNILGFLYLKYEDEKENYGSITPKFSPKKRLKVGTFKVNSSGFRLGERFLKIIFDNALIYNVDEIYVTLFDGRDELERLSDLLKKWGFEYWGIKNTPSGKESVLIKKLKTYNQLESVIYNFPNLKNGYNSYILPIKAEFHTELLPDAKLETEELDLSNLAHRYALEKIYITRAYDLVDIKDGDLLLFYRMGPQGTDKKSTSVITSIGIFKGIEDGFSGKEEFLKSCTNRTVFSNEQLNNLWDLYKYDVKLVKFIFYKELKNNVSLSVLRKLQIIGPYDGPRPFTKISQEALNKILEASSTNI